MSDIRELPHNIEAEQAVLGAMFISKDAVVRTKEVLDAEDFYLEPHKLIFNTVIDLVNNNMPVDLTIVVDELNKRNILTQIGGASYIAKLANSIPTTANVTYHARLVYEKSLLRRLITTATDIVSAGYSSTDPLEDIMDDAERKILQVIRNRQATEFKSISEVIIETQNYLEEVSKRTEQVTGLPTGFIDLDNLTSGLQDNALYILAARPAMGKTAFALNIGANAAVKTKKTVAFFSLEMDARALTIRLLSAMSGVGLGDLIKGNLDRRKWEQILESSSRLSETNIYIDDTAGIRINDLRAKCRRLATSERGLDLVIIDYLQLLQGSPHHGGNRQQEVSEISRSLKTMALELGIPVIALAQLSRAVESREDKRPQLSDLRESGSIEQDADLVAFLYRDDYYTQESLGPGQPSQSELLIRKHRAGPTDTINLLFFKENSLFRSVQDQQFGGEF